MTTVNPRATDLAHIASGKGSQARHHWYVSRACPIHSLQCLRSLLRTVKVQMEHQRTQLPEDGRETLLHPGAEVTRGVCKLGN